MEPKKVNWSDDAEVLAWFRDKNPRGRRMLEKLGLILSERVVRVERLPASYDAAIMVEIETPHAVCAFTMLSHGGEMDAVILKGRDAAFLGGTWRKRGHIVGHACAYLETKVFPVSRKPIKRGSKNVCRSAPIIAYMMAAAGIAPSESDGCHKNPAWLAADKALKESCDEIAVERARETLAAAGESMTA